MTTPVELTIERLLFGRARTLSLTGTPPLAWPNRKEDPAKPYVRVDHLRNDNARLFSKGSNPHLRQGILRLTVVAPLDAGPEQATTLAGEIAQHFPAGLALSGSGLRVRVQKAPTVGTALKQDASTDLQVSIPYECFA